MNYYRSTHKDGGGEGDFSASYTATVNNIVQMASCAYKYANNTIFNENVIIGNNIQRITGMFRGCSNFNQVLNFHIPSNVFEASTAFTDCPNVSGNIYFEGNILKNLKVTGLLSNTFGASSRSKRINIYFNSIFNGVFNINNYQSLVSKDITWTDMTNGFYNSVYNIYCYNNYNG